MTTIEPVVANLVGWRVFIAPSVFSSQKSPTFLRGGGGYANWYSPRMKARHSRKFHTSGAELPAGHKCPDESHRCGINAYTTLTPEFKDTIEQMSWDHKTENVYCGYYMLGLTQAYGKVVVHDDGWRAQYVEVIGLFLTSRRYFDRLNLKGWKDVPVVDAPYHEIKSMIKNTHSDMASVQDMLRIH